MRSSDWSSGVGAADRRGGAADGGRALDALPQAGRTGDRQRGVRRQRVNTIANRITVDRIPTATAEARSANPAPPRSRRPRERKNGVTGTRVSERVDIDGRRPIKTKT